VSTTLKCARTRLPIPGPYTVRTVQVEDKVVVQDPPDYVTRVHTLGAGVYCSPLCAVLHITESLELDGDLTTDALSQLSSHMEDATDCVRAHRAKASPRDEEPF
jgi:hypothetical protein